MNKELTYQTGSIETSPEGGNWAAAFTFAPPSASEKASRGVLMAAASISASETFDAALAGRQILSALQESYYTQVTGGILPALEKAAAAAHQRLVTLVFSGQEGEEAVDFNLVVGVLWGSVFYLAQLGEARAVIRRGGDLKLIGHRSGAEEGDLAVGEKPDIRTASGLLEVGDKIILGTPKFFDKIPAPELSAAMEVGAGEFIAGKLRDKYQDDHVSSALILTLGVDGIPNPTEDALILAEPTAVSAEESTDSEAKVAEETVPAEASSAAVPEEDYRPVMTEPETDEEASQPELGKEVASSVGKFTDRAKIVLAQAWQFSQTTAKHSHRLAKSSGVLPFFKKTFGKLWDSLGSPRTAVEDATSAKNRRTLLVLAGALLIILLIGVGLNSLFKGENTKKDRFAGLVAAASAQYDEADATASLNREQSKRLLLSASERLNEADLLDIDDAKVNSLRAKIGSLLETVNQVFRVDPSPLVDLTALKAGATGIDLDGSKDILYVLDPTGGLYQVTTSDKKASVLSSDLSLSKGQNIFQVGTNVFSYVPGQGVYGYDTKTKKLSQATKNDSAWGNLTDWATYTTNAYALDAGKSTIWRYTPATSAQFGKSTVWSQGEAGLQTASSISVDGAVWVAVDGELFKFLKGKKESFLLQEVSPVTSKIVAVYSTPETKNIYLLEAGRLVVVDKTGLYLSQYTSDKLQKATALLVDEAGKKAYILAEQFIYLIELR